MNFLSYNPLVGASVHFAFAAKILHEPTYHQYIRPFCQGRVADVLILESCVDPHIHTWQKVKQPEAFFLLQERITTTQGDAVQ
jgi:hypothetical protein